MTKTTVYLPGELKAAIARLAREEQRSEADIIREALEAIVSSRARPRPTIPLTGKALGDPMLSERVDEALEGFGSS